VVSGVVAVGVVGDGVVDVVVVAVPEVSLDDEPFVWPTASTVGSVWVCVRPVGAFFVTSPAAFVLSAVFEVSVVVLVSAAFVVASVTFGSVLAAEWWRLVVR
jgi:hypothetical protein